MTIRQVAPLATEASIVGIDIGGTKTHLRLRDPSGERDLVLSRPATGVTANGIGDASSLMELVARFSRGAPVAAMGVGAHGCDDKDECQAFQDAFAPPSPSACTSRQRCRADAGGLRVERQIGVVAGTGSIAVCRTADGEMLVAGGWGWIMGDEGSAASLVREAARAVALHLDRGGAAERSAGRATCSPRWRSRLPRVIGSRLGSLGSAKDVGRHAGLLSRQQTTDPRLADDSHSRGRQALADLVVRLRLRGAKATSVVAGGSVIASQPRLWDAFRASVARCLRHGTFAVSSSAARRSKARSCWPTDWRPNGRASAHLSQLRKGTKI